MEEGALTLNRINIPALTVACERCGCRGRYRIATLSAVYGPAARLTDFLGAMRRESNCPYRDGTWVDRCTMSVPELSEPGAVRTD